MRGPEEAAPESDVAEGAPHPRLARLLIGHGALEAELLNAYRAGRMPQAIMLGGPQSCGKATLAWRLAKFILANPDPLSARVREAEDLSISADHPVARLTAALSHGDVALLRREWNGDRHRTEIRVEDVRAMLRLFQRSSGAGGWRIGIIDCAEDLNASSANALLKIIEEPPPKSLFIFIAHAPARLMVTLRSRCRKFALRALAPDETAAAVRSLGAPWEAAPEGDLALAARSADGSVREALRRLSPESIKLQRRLDALLARLPDLDWAAIHALADRAFKKEGEEAYDALLGAMRGWLSARVHEAGAPAHRLVPYAEVWEKLRDAARDTEIYNLDKRPLILTAFADLADAARRG